MLEEYEKLAETWNKIADHYHVNYKAPHKPNKVPWGSFYLVIFISAVLLTLLLAVLAQ